MKNRLKMKNKEIIFTIGISGSGKSTWAKQYCIDNDMIRLNRDDIRSILFGMSLSDYFKTKYNDGVSEGLITKMFNSMLKSAMSDNKSIIVDNTNLREKYIKDIIKQVDGDYTINVKFFDVSIDECIKRDLQRETTVGESVIKDQYQKYLNIKNNWDINRVMLDAKNMSFSKINNDTSKPSCYVFDIDGTLAINNSGRSPYDWNRVGDDDPNTAIIRILNKISGNGLIKIILASGRDSVCREQTIMWLYRNGISYDTLYMRTENDNRKDSIIKREFMEKILEDYYIEAWIDDRNQVVDMVRDSGITCLQVNYGDF